VRRREFISAIAGATVWPFAARAQQPAMPVIGFIAEVPLVEPLLAAFRRAMAELGLRGGQKLRGRVPAETGVVTASCGRSPDAYGSVLEMPKRSWFSKLFL